MDEAIQRTKHFIVGMCIALSKMKLSERNKTGMMMTYAFALCTVPWGILIVHEILEWLHRT